MSTLKTWQKLLLPTDYIWPLYRYRCLPTLKSSRLNPKIPRARNSPQPKTRWKSISNKEHHSQKLVSVLGLQSRNVSDDYFANTYETFRFQLIGQNNSSQLTAISSSLQVLFTFVRSVFPIRFHVERASLGRCHAHVWSVIIARGTHGTDTNILANIASYGKRGLLWICCSPGNRSTSYILKNRFFRLDLPMANSTFAVLRLLLCHQSRWAQKALFLSSGLFS